MVERRCVNCGDKEDVVDCLYLVPIIRHGYYKGALDLDYLSSWDLQKPSIYCKRCLYLLVRERLPQFLANIDITELHLNRVKEIAEACKKFSETLTFEDDMFLRPDELVNIAYTDSTGTFKGWYIENERRRLVSSNYARPMRCAYFYTDSVVSFFFVIPYRFCIVAPSSYSFKSPEVELENSIRVSEALRLLDYLLQNNFTVVGIGRSDFGSGSYSYTLTDELKTGTPVMKINKRELHTAKLIALGEVVGSLGKALWSTISKSGKYVHNI